MASKVISLAVVLAALSAAYAQVDNTKADPLKATSKSMEDALMNLMLGKTQFGATPMGGSVKEIADILKKTMIPAVTAAHKVDQDSLNTLAGEIGKCGSTKDASLQRAGKAGKEYNTYSQLHQKCRGDQAVQDTSKTSCLTNQRSLYNEKTLKCKAFSETSKKFSTQKENNEVMKKAGSETDEGYIRRISTTVCGTHNHGESGKTVAKGGRGGGLPNSMLDKYMKAKELCDAAKTKWSEKVKECKRKHDSFLVKRSQCNQFQGLMDENSCKQAVAVKDACEAYIGCYNDKKKAYTTVSDKAKTNAKDRRAEWRGLKRMTCLIEAFADGKVTDSEVDTCKRQSHSTKHLILKMPKVPAPKQCALPTLYPATGAYKKKEFGPLPTLAKGISSAPCAGMEAVSTTPANNSPKGAKCERVALNGHYSAGALVKCTNGHDVYKTGQKNSCPQGTKLFSPASRSDWKTFFASASQIRNPHFIVDITRPSNGCGGCTGHAMNSQNNNQKSWVTSDGSQWWLRSTKYSQPSGDYHANCYLDLWHSPKNEDSITFNDHNCNYHSKSYFCQPINLRLKPKKGPASCKCSKVDLAGTYSAGLLVKCEQCTAVYKSTQTNSCPKGMKIFSPQSRSDWKVFLNSAGALAAPHWIVDVTRPQNGCGGCQKYSMKSSTPQQATWRTSDGSPWWLRSTVFNEPNGNYHANCYLSLSQNFKSSDTVGFDDAGCNYGSRSYYCQPTRNDKNYGGNDKIVPKPTKPAPPPPAPAAGFKLIKEKAICGKDFVQLIKEGSDAKECAQTTVAEGYKYFVLGRREGNRPGRCHAMKTRKAECKNHEDYDSYEVAINLRDGGEPAPPPLG